MDKCRIDEEALKWLGKRKKSVEQRAVLRTRNVYFLKGRINKYSDHYGIY
jgi:hypothetical protein